MAMFERITPQSCRVQVTNGVAAAIANRFCIADTAAGTDDVMITHVPTSANGAPAQGILCMKPDTVRTGYTGLVTSSYEPPKGAEPTIELGEACTRGAPLRVGGLNAEVDGAAYLADATGDYIVGYAKEAGAIGQIIRFEFFNAGRVP